MNNLKDENDSLKCQLEAYKNELDVNKQESNAELSHKNKQISMLQQTLKGMQEVRLTWKVFGCVMVGQSTHCMSWLWVNKWDIIEQSNTK